MTTTFAPPNAPHAAVYRAPAPDRLTEAEVDQLRYEAQLDAEEEAEFDRAILYIVEERDQADTGERVSIDDLARDFGFDPATIAG